MAKVYYNEIGDRENVYQAADVWKENCLIQDRSLLFQENNQLWTLHNLQTLKSRFIDNPNNEKLSFDEKFEAQLQGAPQEIYQLAMEIMYVYYLFPYSGSVSYRTKLRRIKDIASWGNVSYNEKHPSLKALELGIGATGTFYNTAKFDEVSFIIQFAITIKKMTFEERRTLLNDPWELKKIILETKDIIGKNVQVQHIITHFLTPDYFECMASAGHKTLIVKNFKEYIQNKGETDVDKQLYEIRQALEADGRYGPVNFYHNRELEEIWRTSSKKSENELSGEEVVKETPTTYKISEIMNITNLGNLVFENEDILQSQIQTALKTGKHIIFTGPPGTGKSKLAVEITKQIGVSNKLVTATSNWTTYDTIGGYKPNKDGELFFDPGLFLQCFKNKERANINDWLIIDEINRADIDKAFGPLFSVLTGDEVTLPYEAGDGTQIVLKPEGKVNGEIQPNEYVVPNDWRIIGTMNTVDKSSLFEMSYAFMRRFAFIPVGVPKSITLPLVEQYLEAWSIQEYMHAETLKTLWEIINQYRKFGPAILRDIAKYTAESEDDFTSAIILYVLPQFEGLSDYKINDFVRQLSEKLGDVIAADLLKDFIEDFFQIGVLDEI